MNRIGLLVLVFAVVLLPLLSQAQGSEELRFRTLTKWVIPGPLKTGPAHLVARSRAELKQAVDSLRQPFPRTSQTKWDNELEDLLASFDFGRYMVLGVVKRGSSSLCTGMTISAVTATKQELSVFYTEYKPTAGTICLASIGAAYHLIEVPQSDLPVNFEEVAAPNPSIEGTSSSGLRPLPAAPHVKR